MAAAVSSNDLKRLPPYLTPWGSASLEDIRSFLPTHLRTYPCILPNQDRTPPPQYHEDSSVFPEKAISGNHVKVPEVTVSHNHPKFLDPDRIPLGDMSLRNLSQHVSGSRPIINIGKIASNPHISDHGVSSKLHEYSPKIVAGVVWNNHQKRLSPYCTPRACVSLGDIRAFWPPHLKTFPCVLPSQDPTPPPKLHKDSSDLPKGSVSRYLLTLYHPI